MWWSRRILLALILLALAPGLTACGFKPLYGRQDGDVTVEEFSRIVFEQPENRVTQQVRNHLLDMVTPLGTPQQPLYRLELQVTETVTSVLVTRTDEVTRNNLSLQTLYRLRDYRTGTILHQGQVSSLVSYNLVRADYANLVSERDARGRATRDNAEQLRIVLGNYFSRRQKQPQQPS
ncbi:hypothetical protein V6B08_04815 [Ferrovibrio sp. MS7]|jgi:LPS-assembly lipoprotein|uniref:hypothetical protein n=1 Tax=Ferrovibrio TaxID=1231242 RepID=UPI003136D50F